MLRDYDFMAGNGDSAHQKSAIKFKKRTNFVNLYRVAAFPQRQLICLLDGKIYYLFANTFSENASKNFHFTFLEK